MEPKKDRPSKSNEFDQMMMGELALCLSEVFKTTDHQTDDSFENYTNQLKMRLQADSSIFQKRFVDGYESLMKALQEESKNNDSVSDS